ncbi:MAG: hypothetical protein MHM6MM_001018 [Cercozoa sp. M6MM]
MSRLARGQGANLQAQMKHAQQLLTQGDHYEAQQVFQSLVVRTVNAGKPAVAAKVRFLSDRERQASFSAAQIGFVGALAFAEKGHFNSASALALAALDASKDGEYALARVTDLLAAMRGSEEASVAAKKIMQKTLESLDQEKKAELHLAYGVFLASVHTDASLTHLARGAAFDADTAAETTQEFLRFVRELKAENASFLHAKTALLFMAESENTELPWQFVQKASVPPSDCLTAARVLARAVQKQSGALFASARQFHQQTLQQADLLALADKAGQRFGLSPLSGPGLGGLLKNILGF